ncbi:hypothetical protein OIU76_013624 [Salix suchowensis]|nr:hypothetical protein OIU76_013624 [Salix suchowensis]KAJ6318116.1 hypothetical protein OIU76_013624 [Salix suchowensis]
MNTSSCISISTTKPCCRIINSYRSLSHFGFSLPNNLIIHTNLSKSHPKSVYNHEFHCCNNRSRSQDMGRTCIVNLDRRGFNVCDWNWGHARGFSSNFHVDKGSNSRGVLVIPQVASDIRNHSTSVEGHVNEKGFESIYIQGGLNVKPLVIEKIETESNVAKEGKEEKSYNRVEVNGSTVNTNFFKDLNESTTPKIVEREVSEVEKEAWQLLRGTIVNYCGNPVGTVAANDPADRQPLNYDQVFIRDFVPSALAFLLNGETEIVKNFLLHTLQLQSWEKTVDCYSPGQGLMPASFKVKTVPLDGSDGGFEEVLDPDFGESAIGRVAPVDSGLWWIILLRAYGKITGDHALQERVDVQTGIRLGLNLCLSDGFDMFPTLLVTDGSCMIDRRMGIHGHPLEIQALFYSALRCAREMLIVNDETKNLVATINNRLSALSFHIREYYWVDMKKINEIYRYNTEEYSTNAVNKFNIYPDQIPSWLVDWIPEEGGYLIGNLQPAHMDFRFFHSWEPLGRHLFSGNLKTKQGYPKFDRGQVG